MTFIVSAPDGDKRHLMKSRTVAPMQHLIATGRQAQLQYR